ATGDDGDGGLDTGDVSEEATGTSAEVSRARVLDADGTSAPVEVVDGEAHVPEGADDRVLVLAERTGVTAAHASGSALPQADPVDGWAQAYTLPADATTVRLSASPLWYRAAVMSGWLVLLVSAVVALPIGRG